MLKFFVDLLSQASILVALFTMVGLILLKKPANEIAAGSMKSLIGFILLGAGANVITSSLAPFGSMVEAAFNVQGVVPNNEAIVSLALTKYGTQVSLVMILSMIIHIIIARFTPFKIYISNGTSYILYGRYDYGYTCRSWSFRNTTYYIIFFNKRFGNEFVADINILGDA